MKTTIIKKLSEIEAQHNIRILYACESGSRGWEFPSPDSDYDVRFIFARSFKEYISIKESNDNLMFPVNAELDLNGWDLRKTLQLIRKSNTTPFEWLQSPIIYKEEPGFRKALWDICSKYFNPKGNVYHYLGIAKGALATLNDEGFIKIKKLFYVLRPLLAALWCKERNTIAPMSIKLLMGLLTDELKLEIAALIKVKETAEEGYLIKPSSTLRTWIKDIMSYCEAASHEMPQQIFELGLLDDFFVKTIQDDYTRFKG